jgi:alpha-L-rhamnosidase
MAPQPYGDWLWYGGSADGRKVLNKPLPAWQTFSNRASMRDKTAPMFKEPQWDMVHPLRMRSFLSTAAMAPVVEQCARMAALLHREKDRAWLNDLHARLLVEIEKVFFDPASSTFSRQPESGPWGSDVEDAYALFTGVVPAAQRDQVYAKMMDGVRKRGHTPITGLITTAPFFLTLSEFGDADDAYEIMAREGYPGLRHLLQLSPDGVAEWFYVQRDGIGSRCHAGLAGALFPWFYYGLGGLRPDDQQPGFKKFTLAPQIPARLESAGITHESPYGTVVSRWHQKDGQIDYKVTVPPNSTARVILPKAKAEEVRVDDTPLDKAAGVSSVLQDGGRVSFDLAAGTYAFGWAAR